MVRTRVSTTSNRQPSAGRWVTGGGFGSLVREYTVGRRARLRRGPDGPIGCLRPLGAARKEVVQGPQTSRYRRAALPRGRIDPKPGGPTSPMDASALQLIIPIAGLAAVLFALYLARDVLGRDKGPQAMQDVADTIREGADAFIKRQYSTIGILAVVGAFVIGVVITLFEGKEVADTNVFGIDLGWRTGVAFIVGAACSMASGIIGMYISVRSNVRTAAAARRSL